LPYIGKVSATYSFLERKANRPIFADMKKIITIAIIITSFSTYAQRLTHEFLSTTKNGKGVFTEYIAHNGDPFSIGDTITLGAPSGANNDYMYITMADFMGSKQVVANMKDFSVVIKKVAVYGNKNVGFKCSLVTTSHTKVAKLYVGVEDALEYKELKTNTLSSDEALVELKKAKDKLDLELITQEEYDNRKEKLAPLIK
jgi:hypothetical protein